MFGSRLSRQFSCSSGDGSIICVCGWHILFSFFLHILFLNFTWMNLLLLFRLLFELMRMKTRKLGLSNWVSLMKFQCLLSLILRIFCKSIPSHYSHLVLILSFSHSLSLNLENWRLRRRWTHISITDISCWFNYVTYPFFTLIIFIFLHFTREFQCFVLKIMSRLLYQRWKKHPFVIQICSISRNTYQSDQSFPLIRQSADRTSKSFTRCSTIPSSPFIHWLECFKLSEISIMKPHWINSRHVFSSFIIGLISQSVHL